MQLFDYQMTPSGLLHYPFRIGLFYRQIYQASLARCQIKKPCTAYKAL